LHTEFLLGYTFLFVYHAIAIRVNVDIPAIGTTVTIHKPIPPILPKRSAIDQSLEVPEKADIE
jgi:hypothetical protein